MLALAAFGLAFGACKKDEKAAGDEAAKPAEAEPAAAEEPAAEEPAAEEAAAEEPAAEEAAGEAAAGETIATGVKECDDLIAAYAKCDKLPQASKDAFMTGAKAWKDAVDKGGDAAKTALATSCAQAAEGSKAAMAAMGCE